MHYCPRCNHHIRNYGYTCGCGHYWDQDFFFSEFGFNMQQQILREEIVAAELEIVEEVVEGFFGDY